MAEQQDGKGNLWIQKCIPTLECMYERVIANKIETLSRLMAREAAATYYIGKYYFTVNTDRKRSDYGMLPRQDIPLPVQQQLRRHHAISIFHEYFHYIHEISTVVGNAYLNLDMVLKSTFSRYFDKRPDSSEHQGIPIKNLAVLDWYVKVYSSKQAIKGGKVIDGKLLRIMGCQIKTEKISIPNGHTLVTEDFPIPLLTVEAYDTEKGRYRNEKLDFGQFFIYEGIAYELDRELERQLLNSPDIRDHSRYTEYTLTRLVADYVYPGVTKEVYLPLASFSLSYLNCGFMFMKLLERVKKEVTAGAAVKDVVQTIRQEVSILLQSKLTVFAQALRELVEVFDQRPLLQEAFSTIAHEAIRGYTARVEQPSFEVDYILTGRYAALLDLIPICDYMYAFTDEDEYYRDLLGSASFSMHTAEAFRIVTAVDHYEKSHQLDSTASLETGDACRCPFYTTCTFSSRLTHEALCLSKPWRQYENSLATRAPFCWYALGIAEFKGLVSYTNTTP